MSFEWNNYGTLIEGYDFVDNNTVAYFELEKAVLSRGIKAHIEKFRALRGAVPQNFDEPTFIHRGKKELIVYIKIIDEAFTASYRMYKFRGE